MTLTLSGQWGKRAAADRDTQTILRTPAPAERPRCSAATAGGIDVYRTCQSTGTPVDAGEEPPGEVGVRAVAVDEVEATASRIARREPGHRARRLDDVSGEAQRLARDAGVEVPALHRARPRLDRVLDEVGLEDQLVRDAVAPEKLGDRAVARQDDRAMSHPRVEKLQDRVEASPGPAVARRVVDEENAHRARSGRRGQA